LFFSGFSTGIGHKDNFCYIYIYQEQKYRISHFYGDENPDSDKINKDNGVIEVTRMLEK